MSHLSDIEDAREAGYLKQLHVPSALNSGEGAQTGACFNLTVGMMEFLSVKMFSEDAKTSKRPDGTTRTVYGLSEDYKDQVFHTFLELLQLSDLCQHAALQRNRAMVRKYNEEARERQERRHLATEVPISTEVKKTYPGVSESVTRDDTIKEQKKGRLRL